MLELWKSSPIKSVEDIQIFDTSNELKVLISTDFIKFFSPRLVIQKVRRVAQEKILEITYPRITSKCVIAVDGL